MLILVINLFSLSQKIEQKAPEKKIPSTAANAINRSANESDSIHFNAQSAFFLIAGKFSIALNNLIFFYFIFTYVSINKE